MANIDSSKLRRALQPGLLAFSVILIVAHSYLPPKRTVVDPDPQHEPAIYGFIDAEGVQSARWDDQSHREWRCDFEPQHEFSCGFTVSIDTAFVAGIDLRSYDTLLLTLDYQGPADKLRVFMRNHDARYSEPDNANSTKFMATLFAFSERSSNTIALDLNNFGVAEWWLNESHERRQWAKATRDNIVQLGVDFIEPGHHVVRINSIILQGEWLGTQQLLLLLLTLWLLVVIVNSTRILWRDYWFNRGWRNRLQHMGIDEPHLGVEKASLASLQHKDPLTGVLNRHGALNSLRNFVEPRSDFKNTAVMLLDLDNFKQVNEKLGHDKGDAVLRSFGALLQMNTDQHDILARWGGEQFILVCPYELEAQLKNRAEKLRTLTAAMNFSELGDINLTISIGVATQHAAESFDATLERAQVALRSAKHNGRNQVVTDVG